MQPAQQLTHQGHGRCIVAGHLLVSDKAIKLPCSWIHTPDDPLLDMPNSRAEVSKNGK